MWNELNYIWKEAYALAWESFTKNTIPSICKKNKVEG